MNKIWKVNYHSYGRMPLNAQSQWCSRKHFERRIFGSYEKARRELDEFVGGIKSNANIISHVAVDLIERTKPDDHYDLYCNFEITTKPVYGGNTKFRYHVSIYPLSVEY